VGGALSTAPAQLSVSSLSSAALVESFDLCLRARARPWLVFGAAKMAVAKIEMLTIAVSFMAGRSGGTG
jgi:hypothetical protein